MVELSARSQSEFNSQTDPQHQFHPVESSDQQSLHLIHLDMIDEQEDTTEKKKMKKPEKARQGEVSTTLSTRPLSPPPPSFPSSSFLFCSSAYSFYLLFLIFLWYSSSSMYSIFLQRLLHYDFTLADDENLQIRTDSHRGHTHTHSNENHKTGILMGKNHSEMDWPDILLKALMSVMIQCFICMIGEIAVFVVEYNRHWKSKSQEIDQENPNSSLSPSSSPPSSSVPSPNPNVDGVISKFSVFSFSPSSISSSLDDIWSRLLSRRLVFQSFFHFAGTFLMNVSLCLSTIICVHSARTLEPILAVIMAQLVLRQSPNLYTLVGITLVIVGNFLVYADGESCDVVGKKSARIAVIIAMGVNMAMASRNSIFKLKSTSKKSTENSVSSPSNSISPSSYPRPSLLSPSLPTPASPSSPSPNPEQDRQMENILYNALICLFGFPVCLFLFLFWPFATAILLRWLDSSFLLWNSFVMGTTAFFYVHCSLRVCEAANLVTHSILTILKRPVVMLASSFYLTHTFSANVLINCLLTTLGMMIHSFPGTNSTKNGTEKTEMESEKEMQLIEQEKQGLLDGTQTEVETN